MNNYMGIICCYKGNTYTNEHNTKQKDKKLVIYLEVSTFLRIFALDKTFDRLSFDTTHYKH